MEERILKRFRNRIKKELEDMKDLPTHCNIGKTDNEFIWKGSIIGPSDTPYAGGFFSLDIKFTEKYPMVPPKIKFNTKIYHPNIDANGNICLDILNNNWSPVLTIVKILLSISSLLNEPNPDDPLVKKIALEYTNNIEKFKLNARRMTLEYAS